MHFRLLAISISMLFFSGTAINSNICEPIGEAPIITSPTSGDKLSSRYVNVIGKSSEQSTKVSVLLDGNTVLTLTPDSDGSFEGSVSVPGGDHSLMARSSTPCESKDSLPVNIAGYSSPTLPTEPTKPSAPDSTVGAGRPPSGQAISPGGSAVEQEAGDSDPKASDAMSGRWAYFEGIKNGDTTSDRSVVIIGNLQRAGLVRIYRGGELVAETNSPSEYFRLRVPLVGEKNIFKVIATIDDRNIEQILEIVRIDPTDDSTTIATADSDEEKTWCSKCGWCIYALIGAIIMLIFGGFWWFLIAKRRKKKDEENNQDNMSGGGYL